MTLRRRTLTAWALSMVVFTLLMLVTTLAAAAGLSTDQGHTFTPLMHLAQVCPLVCAEADSGVNQLCPAAWNCAGTETPL